MDPTKLESPEWPCVSAESGWRGDVVEQPSDGEVVASFALDGGSPLRVRFVRGTTEPAHWPWEAGADARVPKDVLDAAALRISMRMNASATR